MNRRRKVHAFEIMVERIANNDLTGQETFDASLEGSAAPMKLDAENPVHIKKVVI